ncbi:MAG: N-methyl-D-aspartate receptor NMDAR2C subunit [Leptothrix sp. (in: b-proteobacteria)]
MTPLEHSWHRTWNHLGLSAPPGLREQLLAAYGEPHRHYHGLQHLEECIARLDESIHLAARPGEVEMALWFHDAIYDLQGKDNERRSADWACRELAACGAAEPVIRRIDNLIMATCHAAVPLDPDQQLLVDIDLAILGAPPARFAEYNRQIMAEYAWVPDALYRSKRREVLHGFLSRPFIYSTGHFRARLERQARANLLGAIH